MRWLVIGKTGQLARALQAELGAASSAVFLDREALDLEAIDHDVLWERVQQADCVIIAAADTAVDAAETHAERAMAVNADAPRAIARAAFKAGVPVVHLSTDYVFDGTMRTPYPPDARTHPVNAYGRSKMKGERAVLLAQPRAAVLRTSWVYDTQGRNFVTTMLRLGAERERLRVVADQIGRPTRARDLARACLTVGRALHEGHPGASGIFHVTNTGEPTSWAGFARAVFAAAGMDTQVEDIPSADYPQAATRPAFSVLDTTKFERTFGTVLPDWREALQSALASWDGAAP